MTRRDEPDRKDENAATEAPNETTGEVLGISRVPAGPTGEIQHKGSSAGAGDDDGHVMALEDERDLGARDVTHDGRGQTGPETGGHGATPQRSGSTGTDIGG